MASTREYLNFILEQLAPLGQVTHRAMMGEYILYYRGKIAAYLCDNRLLVKPVAAARELLPQAPMEPPYAGAKNMLLVEDVDDGPFWCGCFRPWSPSSPSPRQKRRNSRGPAESSTGGRGRFVPCGAAHHPFRRNTRKSPLLLLSSSK